MLKRIALALWFTVVSGYAAAVVVNVRTAGAAGNGTTDDRAVINSSISTACGSGGSVYFPVGVYNLSSPLTPVSCSALTLYGDGSSSSVLKLGGPGASTYAAVFEDDGPGTVTIHDLGFQGQNMTAPGPSFNGGVTAVNIYNVIVKDFGTPGYAAGHHVEHDGIYCNGCGTLTVANSVVTGNERTGIEMPMTHTATVSGNILNGNGALGAVAESLAGTDGPQHIEALNNIMRGNGSGGFDIETENGSTPVAYGKMHGNLAENNGNDIYSDLAGFGLVLGNRTYGEMTNNWVDGQSTHPALPLPFPYYGDGIVLTPTGTATVTNNYIMNGGNAGLLINGGTGTVTGNWAIGNVNAPFSIGETGTITPNYSAAPADTVPPSAPTGVTATVASRDQVNIAWNESTDNLGVKGYNVYRNGTLIDHTAGTSYPDTGLSNTAGLYTVRAFDGVGNLSAPLTSTTGTPALIAHAESSGGPVTVNTTGGNFIGVCTRQGQTVTDTDNNTYIKLFQQTAADDYDGDGCTFYGAFAITTSTHDAITVSNGMSFAAVVFSHIASGPDQAVDDVHSYQNLGPVTPSRANELALTGVNGVYRVADTPTITMNSGWTITGTGTDSGNGGAFKSGYTIGYLVTGAGTPTPLSNFVTTNQQNGGNSSLITLYSDVSPAPLAIGPSTLPHGMRTAVYPQTSSNLRGPYPPTCITPTGGTEPYTVSMTGTLPPGLTFSANCITGTPTASGTYSGIVFSVTDSAGVTASTPAISLTIDPLRTTAWLQPPNYGFVVFPGAVRHPGVILTNPAGTGRVDWSISDPSKGTLSCTSNCAGTVMVTAIGAAGNCSVAGTKANYSITGGNDFTVTATTRDQNEDGTYSHDSETYHICKGDYGIDIQPTYNQAFFGQDKYSLAYVLGQVSQNNITWSCTAPDNSNCDAALDVALPTGSGPGTQRHNRDVVFRAPSVVGTYKLTACGISGYDGTTQVCNYEWMYVGGPLTATHLGSDTHPLTAEKTEYQACFDDPRFAGRSWTVKADGTGDYVHIWQALATEDGTHQFGPGYMLRIFNQDTTGTNPTQYPDAFYIRAGGTRDFPIVICGVTDNSGHLPIQQRRGITGSGRDQGYFGTGWDGALISITAFGAPNGAGYETSAGPDFVNLFGLHLTDSAHANDAIGIWGIGGRQLHMEGMHTEWMSQGALINSNTSASGQHWAEFTSVIGGHYENCGTPGSSGNHCLYLEGMHPWVTQNAFGAIVPGADGAWHKIRGGDAVVSFNSYIGAAGLTNNWFPAMSDAAPFTNVEMLLGPPGDSNAQSWYYDAHGVDLNWLHIAANEEYLAHDYVYGSIFQTDSAPTFNYSTQQVVECGNHWSTCTNGEDHIGGFFLWNNTFDRPSALAISDDTFYNNGYYNHDAIHSYPWLLYQNNSMWSQGTQTNGDQAGFVMDWSPYFQGGFKNNVIAPGQIDLSTPIIAGHAGWNNQLGGGGTTGPFPPWTAYEPKESYLSGLNTFVTAATIPYDTTTYQPVSGSPLIGAGAVNTDPLIAVLPLRYEPDPVNGGVLPRSDSGLTIGARAATTPIPFTVTTNSLPAGTVGSVYPSTTLAAVGGTAPYSWARTDSNTSAPGLTILNNGGISGVPTAAGTYGPLTFRVTDSTGATADSGPLTIVINPASIPVAATPTFSPAAGTFTSAQSVTISSATSGAAICYTVDGTTPTANGSGTCTHGTTYSTAVAVAISRTLKAIASKNGFTDSTVASAAYTINLPSTLAVSTHSLSNGTAGTAYSQTLTATGATGAVTWTMVGTLPAGLTLSGATVSGTPTTAGTSTGLVFTAHDSNGIAASPALSLTINPATTSTTPRTVILGNASITGNAVIH